MRGSVLGPVDRTVSVLIDRSYPVVKEVYLKLPMLQYLYESEAINYFYEHWDTVVSIEENIEQIKTVGDNIDAVLKVPEYIDLVKQEAETQIENIKTTGTEYKDLLDSTLAGHLQELEDAKDSHTSTLEEKNQELLQQLEDAKNSSLEELGQELSDSLGSLDTATSEYLEQIKQSTQDTEAKFQETTDSLLETIEKEANENMYSFRYVDEEVTAFTTFDLNLISPTKNIKVGDHLVTPTGAVYRIIELTDETFTVGEYITSIKGDAGTSIKLLGSFEDVKSLEGITGNAGDAYVVLNVDPGATDPADRNHVYVWDVNLQTWSDVGPIQGAKGEDGLSVNEFLMTPDPVDYFNEIYGKASGDIIGDLVLNPWGIEPDPKDSFESALS